MIPKKQATKQEHWLKTLQTIEDTYPKKNFEGLVDRTAEQIRRDCRGMDCAVAWSGGKDSIILERLCNLAGIKDNFAVLTTGLEYPAFLKWVREHGPSGLEIVYTYLDLKWLAKNQEMLFPRDSRIAAKWFRIVQHKGQARFFKKRGLDVLLLGRRVADGNYTGPKGRHIYANREGVVRYSPIADWTHEDVLRGLRYFNITLPPNYFWKEGFKVGTGPWPARQWTKDIMDGWSQVYEIDPGIVKGAALYIESAKEFLGGRE